MFYIDIRKTFIYNNDKYSSKRSENNLPSIKQSVETSVINDKGELVVKGRIKLYHGVQNLVISSFIYKIYFIFLTFPISTHKFYMSCLKDLHMQATKTVCK